MVQSREGWGRYVANSDGFLAHEFAAVPTGPRALLMGDSFTQGLQVREGERYSEVLERLVPGLEVLNVSTGGRSPIHYALYLPRFQAAFRPSFTIVQVNDADLSEMEDARTDAVTLAEFRGPPSPSPAGARADRWVERLHDLGRRSALLREISARVELLAKQEYARLARKVTGRRANTEDVVALPATPRAEAMVDSLLGEVVRLSPRTILVYVPHLRYFDAVPRDAYPVRRAWYRALAERRGLAFVDPTDALLAEFRRTGEPLQGFANTRPGIGHMNARGHELLGKLLAGTILRLTAQGGAWADPPAAVRVTAGAGARP